MAKSQICPLVLAVVVATALVTTGGSARNVTRRAIAPPGSETGLPFSPGVLVGDTLYVSGHEGRVNGQLAPGGVGPEAEASLTSIKGVVEAAGMHMTDVVNVNVYLADINDFAEMNRVYKTFFAEPRPARTTVQVAGLGGNGRVEISAIAVKQH